jgi:hypothetical protein
VARLTKLVLGTATCVAIVIVPAAAAPQWLPATTLVGPLPTKLVGVSHISSMSPSPVAGFDADGDLFVAYRQWDGSHYRVGVTQRMRGGALSTQTLGTPGADVDARSVVLAVSRNGDAIVSWTESAGMVFAALGHAGADLVATGLIGTAVNSASPSQFNVAAGDAGDLAIVFQSTAPGTLLVARRGPGGPLGGATAIPGSLTSFSAMAITPAGETVVAWTKQTTTPTARVTDEVDTSSAPRAGTFPAPAVVPGTTGPTPASDNEEQGGQIRVLATDGAGTIHALTTQSHKVGSNTTGDLRVALRPAGGAFGAATVVPGTATTTSVVGITGGLWTDRAGDELIEALADVTFVPLAYTRRPGGGFAPGDPLLGGDLVSGTAATTMGPLGVAGTLYRSTTGSGLELFRPIGFDGAVGAAVTLSTGEHIISSQGALTFDGEGDGVAVWPDFDTPSESIRIAGFDSAGPRLSAVTIPGTAAPGAAVSFSATASDTWSTVASITWDFGDGSGTATGSPVTHTYPVLGSYTVTATATDALGNTGAPVAGVLNIATMPPVDRTAPKITKLSVSPKRFAAGSSSKKKARSAARRAPKHTTPHGTAIRFTLSEDAKVAFTALGQKVKHCRKVHGHAHCTTTTPTFTISGGRSFKRGSGHLTFSGRVAGKALKRGTYRLEVVATDAAHNRSKTATTSFTIVSG